MKSSRGLKLERCVGGGGGKHRESKHELPLRRNASTLPATICSGRQLNYKEFLRMPRNSAEAFLAPPSSSF